jgi:hypothetical protein
MTDGLRKSSIRKKDLEQPHRLLANLHRDYLSSASSPFILEAVVVSIDHVGGQLAEQPANPKNSIKAAIITNSYDSFTADEDLTVFWPLFSHDTVPIKEGEHVYVFFLDENHEHGLWLGRVAEPLEQDNKNYVDGIEKYKKNNTSKDGNQTPSLQTVRDSELPVKEIEVSGDFARETVKSFLSRVGDRVIEGSNNTAIILSRDRIDVPDSGIKEGSGTIDLVVGRETENIDFDKDKARIIISMKTDVDANFGTDSIGKSAGEKPSIIVKADEIRIIARKGMKIVVESGELHLDAEKIFVGKDAEESMVLGDKLVGELEKALDALTTPPIGMLGQIPIPMNPATLATLKQIRGILKQNVLSKKNKVK